MSPDGQANAAYTLVPVGIQPPEAAFRVLHPLHFIPRAKLTKTFPLPSVFYYLDPVGRFTGDNLAISLLPSVRWWLHNGESLPS